MAATVAVVGGFGSSTALTNAYGYVICYSMIFPAFTELS